MSGHPTQPLVLDEQGICRFKRNSLVAFLLDFVKERGLPLNDMACMPWPAEDWEQLMQLLGYSVCGYCDLLMVSEESKDVAMERGRKLVAKGADK